MFQLTYEILDSSQLYVYIISEKIYLFQKTVLTQIVNAIVTYC